jgi:DNA-binding CsgD family transcriptional regulator
MTDNPFVHALRNPDLWNHDDEPLPEYLGRRLLERRLEELLVRNGDACMSIVAERFMGVPALTHAFVQRRWDAISQKRRVVEIQASDWRRGKTAADMYRELVRCIMQKLKPLVSDEARALGEKFLHEQSMLLPELEDDLLRFFAELRKSGLPLWLIIYNFDTIPRLFPAKDRDWSFLRKLADDGSYNVRYLLLTRRPVSFIIQQHQLERSLFGSLFLNPYRFGALSRDEARSLMNGPRNELKEVDFWPKWLENWMMEWGAMHPYCNQLLCHQLFPLVEDSLRASDRPQIEAQLKPSFRAFCEQLHGGLDRDDLLTPLVAAVENNPECVMYVDQIALLEDLGYFAPRGAAAGGRMLISTFLHDYLVERGVAGLKPRPHALAPVNEHPEGPEDALTKRERQVLRYYAEDRDWREREIADDLGIAVDSVHKYVQSLHKKLEVSTKAELRVVARSYRW